jgi:hypothetical protein
MRPTTEAVLIDTDDRAEMTLGYCVSLPVSQRIPDRYLLGVKVNDAKRKGRMNAVSYAGLL